MKTKYFSWLLALTLILTQSLNAEDFNKSIALDFNNSKVSGTTLFGYEGENNESFSVTYEANGSYKWQSLNNADDNSFGSWEIVDGVLKVTDNWIDNEGGQQVSCRENSNVYLLQVLQNGIEIGSESNETCNGVSKLSSETETLFFNAPTSQTTGGDSKTLPKLTDGGFSGKFMYVTNENSHTIYKVDNNGSYVTLFENYNGASGLVKNLSNDRIYFSDDNNKIYSFGEDGNVTEVNIDPNFISNPNALEIDNNFL